MMVCSVPSARLEDGAGAESTFGCSMGGGRGGVDVELVTRGAVPVGATEAGGFEPAGGTDGSKGGGTGAAVSAVTSFFGCSVGGGRGGVDVELVSRGAVPVGATEAGGFEPAGGTDGSKGGGTGAPVSAVTSFLACSAVFLQPAINKAKSNTR